VTRRKIDPNITLGSRVRRKQVVAAEPEKHLIVGTVVELDMFNRAFVDWDTSRVKRGEKTWFALSGLVLIKSSDSE
jgi:hypothetical protein